MFCIMPTQTNGLDKSYAMDALKRIFTEISADKFTFS